ncbi:Planctomycete cytochrome C [Symmachiella macrocystis]|uniref:Planctomycete cytochrome C n=1 Tax=Symmachiella macrocystis TaxID=2527985 RepID=A0A5C6B4S1_9PLAN|nr:PSD1 and planctomycete cytochrome C domain-containing protein [Symmachiella macrocystis]TWU06747.1 Planctomycete cytochrome C [Symmachiella macrocystis]
MPALRSVIFGFFACLSAISVTFGDEKVSPADAEFFEKHVRPVLAEKCYSCHGAEKQELGIRLDSRDAVITGGDAGPIVDIETPGESSLLVAIGYAGDVQMPPDGQLSADEIAALTRWIKIGMPWPGSSTPSVEKNHDAYKQHWAFQPVADQPLPAVQDADWSRTSIDRFVLARLEQAGLTPAPEADRRTLIRRATFDLIGLPPTTAEVAAFENDSSPDAYEKLIDRLLASPHYGERWARHWLDVARYADNKGYIFFGDKKYHWAYTYRDYVIRALNEDLPYDRFVVEQLAADQLELGEDKRPLTAMGYLTLGAQFSGNIHDIIDDRIDVVTRGLMGLTVSCARCHNHKFDPISAADYYGLYGVFRSSTEPTIPPMFETPPDTEEHRKFAAELAVKQQKLDAFVTEKHTALVTSARKRVAEYLIAAYVKRHQPPTEDFMLLVEEGDLNPTMIQRWQSYLTRTRKSHDPIWSLWHACAEIPADEFGKSVAAIVEQHAADPVQAHPAIIEALRASPPTNMTELAERYSNVLNQVDDKWTALLQQASEAKQPLPTELPDESDEALRLVFYGSQAPPDVPVRTGWGFLTLLPDRPAQAKYKKLLGEVEKHIAETAGAPPRAMVLLDAEEMYAPKVFLRGNPNRPGNGVPRHFPEFLTHEDDQVFQTGSGRLELAQAIVDPANPLTARVLVNRVWLNHFGSALVATPSDFGLRSEAPTHPTLLDHLAGEFIRDGWSLKRLHRRIMLSAVYQQQSHARDDGVAVDPRNRLLWRMNRSRLDFESMRDSLLAVTDQLEQTLGGPAVDIEKTPFTPRRTIYAFVDRMDLPELFRAFDFPDPAATSPQRDATTIAPQALYLMNHKFVDEVVTRIAARPDVADIADASMRIDRLHQILFSRAPTKLELELAVAFLGAEPSQQQWQEYIQALLMTNEFLFVD